MAAFEDFAASLEYWGVMDAILPFLLIFTIVFAVLQKSNILGKDKKQFNVIVAMVIALSVIIPHITGSYPSNFDVIEIINMLLPQIALVAVVLIMLLILVGVFAPAAAGGIAVAGAILVVLLFLGTTEYLYGLDWITNFFGEETISLIVMLLVFGVVIWFVTHEPSKGEKVGKGINDFFERIFKG